MIQSNSSLFAHWNSGIFIKANTHFRLVDKSKLINFQKYSDNNFNHFMGIHREEARWSLLPGFQNLVISYFSGFWVPFKLLRDYILLDFLPSPLHSGQFCWKARKTFLKTKKMICTSYWFSDFIFCCCFIITLHIIPFATF